MLRVKMKRGIRINGRSTEIIEFSQKNFSEEQQNFENEEIKFEEEVINFKHKERVESPFSPSLNLDENTRIVLIPGNPGIVDFYRSFLHDLYDRTDRKYPIYAVSHAGHTSMIDLSEKSSDFGDEIAYSLQHQIDHKADFLDHLQAQSSNPLNFILIGHSVGSYISLRVRRDYENKFNIKQIINLFPTFQKLKEGLAPIIKWIIQPGLRHFSSLIIHFCPLFIKRFFIESYCSNLSKDSQNVVAHGINRYKVMDNILYMALTETKDICDLEHDLLHPLDNLQFLYGKTDRYTPLHQVHHLRSTFPSKLAEEGIQHAFCTCPKQSISVSSRVFDYISENNE